MSNATTLTAQQAIDFIEGFEIVGDNNASRDPTEEEKFVLREFVLQLFDEARVSLFAKIKSTSEADAADPRGEYKGPNLTFDRLNRMRDFAAKQSEEGATTVKINVETLLCLIDTVQHHEYVPRQSAPVAKP
jgi:hypothetical protein